MPPHRSCLAIGGGQELGQCAGQIVQHEDLHWISLSHAMGATNPLLQHGRIPGQVDIDHGVGGLQVQARGTGVRRDEELAGRLMLSVNSLLNFCRHDYPPMDKNPDGKRPPCKRSFAERNECVLPKVAAPTEIVKG
jgi:hypothetical protein